MFLSYARKDGAELAGRLRRDLTARGFEVWIDTREIGGGKVWTREIEEGIDRAQVVLALMTRVRTPSSPIRGVAEDLIDAVREGLRDLTLFSVSL